MIQNYHISTISSASLFTPTITWALLMILQLVQKCSNEDLLTCNDNIQNKNKKYQWISNVLLCRPNNPHRLAMQTPCSGSLLQEDSFATGQYFSSDKGIMAPKQQCCKSITMIIKPGFLKSCLFFIVQMLSVSSIVFGNQTKSQPFGILYVYILNQSIGGVFSQFDKHIEPLTQMTFTNLSIIPLAIWLIGRDPQQANMNPFKDQSYTQIVLIVTCVLIGQSTQMLGAYLKIDFFQKHDAEVQQKLLYLPIVIKLTIDMSFKYLQPNFTQLMGISGISLICILQLISLYKQLKLVRCKDDQDEYFPV